MASKSLLANSLRVGVVDMMANVSLVPSVLSILRLMAGMLINVHRRAKAHRELADLDERTLRDMGLSRSDITWALREKSQDCAIRLAFQWGGQR